MSAIVTKNDNIIQKIVDKIVDSISPDKIILFGSQAKGKINQDSDIDILVIWDTELNPHKRNVYLSRLFPHRDFSLDIFAFTNKEYSQLKDIPGTIIYEAFQNGKILYG